MQDRTIESVLVTGAAGFVGAEVCKQLFEQGIQVVALDGLLAGLYSSEEKRMRYEKLQGLGIQTVACDLRDEQRLQKLSLNVDTVIHLAAMPGLRLSWEEFGLYESCNIFGTMNALILAERIGAKRFVNISTSSVYGATATSPETACPNPVSPYGITKLAAEQVVNVFSERLRLDASTVRLFSVYGPGQRPDMAYRRFIESALSGSEQVIYGDGNQTRTNTFVSDAARGIISCAIRGGQGVTYNIGGDESVSLNRAIEMIEEIAGKDIRLVRQPRFPGDQIETKADTTLAKSELGFENATSFRLGLELQVDELAAKAQGVNIGPLL